MATAPSHGSPQWYQVWVGRPWISVKPDGAYIDSVPVEASSEPRTE